MIPCGIYRGGTSTAGQQAFDLAGTLYINSSPQAPSTTSGEAQRHTWESLQLAGGNRLLLPHLYQPSHQGMQGIKKKHRQTLQGGKQTQGDEAASHSTPAIKPSVPEQCPRATDSRIL